MQKTPKTRLTSSQIQNNKLQPAPNQRTQTTNSSESNEEPNEDERTPRQKIYNDNEPINFKDAVNGDN